MSKFGDAFSSARKAGKKTFKWNGKLYTTKMKGEDTPKKVPVPVSRPDTTTTASTGTTAKTREAASYPRPATGGTLYKAKSTISKIVARSENKPKPKGTVNAATAFALGMMKK